MSTAQPDNPGARRRITTARIAEMKARGEKIAVLTAYDFSCARLIDAAGVDCILVGDSASNVMHGHETTLPITLDQMIDHASAVVRAAQRALIVVDLPFGTYQGDSLLALESSVRIMKEAGAHAVKMEGGEAVIESIRRVLSAGIPVMGHLGLTPQSIYRFGSYVVRARDDDEAQRLLSDARLLQSAGCFALVLEKIPAALAGRVTQSVGMATIGIGAGPQVDGQVLVMHDMLGISTDFSPRFIRRYASVGEIIGDACQRYVADVKAGGFPSADESY
jgi:3-methyl-2-oxobutanoate hydroxymethyltransferase